MQLSLSFAQDPSSKIDPAPNVWSSLSSDQQAEVIAVLARLLAKAAAPVPAGAPRPTPEEKSND